MAKGVLLMIGGNCSLFASKPAHISGHLPVACHQEAMKDEVTPDSYQNFPLRMSWSETETKEITKRRRSGELWRATPDPLVPEEMRAGQALAGRYQPS